MREILKKARLNANNGDGYTQEELAKKLGISTRMYQHLEYGTLVGKVETWDKLEDLFGIAQRQLRENTKKPDDNQAETNTIKE